MNNAVRCSAPVRAAALVYNPEKERARLKMLEAAEILRREKVEPVLWDPEDKAGDAFPGRKCTALAGALKDSQLAIVLGGDGAILQTARTAAPMGIPILSVNLGRLGFMSELEPEELLLLRKALPGGCPLDSRMMLQAVLSDGTHCGHLLNDAVISRPHGRRVLETSLYADDRLLCTVRGDGVIFSTATGSTAYSLSAGGPIVDPMENVILITPLCSHNVLSRSFVLNAERHITVTTDAEAVLSCDGQADYPVPPGGSVCVTRSEYTTDLVRLKERSILRTIHDKLQLP